MAYISVNGSENDRKNMESYGKSVSDRPPANSVPVGHIFMSVSTQEMWQSTGEEWVVF